MYLLIKRWQLTILWVGIKKLRLESISLVLFINKISFFFWLLLYWVCVFLFWFYEGQWSIQPYQENQSSMYLNIKRSKAACRRVTSARMPANTEAWKDKKKSVKEKKKNSSMNISLLPSFCNHLSLYKISILIKSWMGYEST